MALQAGCVTLTAMLLSHEPPPFEVIHRSAGNRVVLTCDHASNRIPSALGALGLSAADLATHVAWDIGAAVVARRLSELLDATLVLTSYSRLVVDANRPPHVDSAVPAITCGVRIPGNEALDAADRAARIETLHRPYHDAIAELLDARAAAGRDPVLLSIHSFTPELLGVPRPWPVGLLYGGDTRLAHRFRDALRRDPALLVGDNEPYSVSDETDFTIPVHGVRRRILHTAFEIRQDGVADTASAHAWAARIAAIWQELDLTPQPPSPLG